MRLLPYNASAFIINSSWPAQSSWQDLKPFLFFWICRSALLTVWRPSGVEQNDVFPLTCISHTLAQEDHSLANSIIWREKRIKLITVWPQKLIWCFSIKWTQSHANVNVTWAQIDSLIGWTSVRMSTHIQHWAARNNWAMSCSNVVTIFTKFSKL